MSINTAAGTTLDQVNTQISDLDQQIANMDEVRKKLLSQKQSLSKERNNLLPSAFAVLIDNSKKRKIPIEEDPEYIKLKELFKEKQNKSISSQKANTRKVYSEEEKTILVNLQTKYTKPTIQKATNVGETSLKRFKREASGVKVPGKRGRRPKYLDIEAYLGAWVRQKRAVKNHVPVRRLLLEAKRRARAQNDLSAKFSWHWFYGFLRRQGLKLRSPILQGENKSFDETQKTVEDFKAKIANLYLTGNYPDDFILNADETGLATESVSTKTICTEEEFTQYEETKLNKPGTVNTVNKSKENTTLMLSGAWSGKKLRALVILPGTGTRRLKINTPENLYKIHREEGSYMDQEGMLKWATYVFRPYASKLPSNKRGILIIDNFKGHISPEIKSYIEGFRFEVVMLPPNTTKFLQPMDLSTNKSFKSFYRQKYEDYACECIDKNITKQGNFQAPSREKRLTWMSDAWENVTEETISNGFNVYKRKVLEINSNRNGSGVNNVEESKVAQEEGNSGEEKMIEITASKSDNNSDLELWQELLKVDEPMEDNNEESDNELEDDEDEHLDDILMQNGPPDKSFLDLFIISENE